MIHKSGKLSLFVFLILSVSLFLSACSAGNQKNLVLMSLDKMPVEVQAAPVSVQQAYQFAAANPDLMKQIPCYCGCGAMGHTSNYACYVQDVDARGIIVFDTHALGCSICVDITQDAMRLLKSGKSPRDIKAYVDATYGQYGPSNIP
ncbi:MAG: PCYCGC domain-containing protein [Anaerolineales bacterium]|nr:PCYCGC domain-containing protein [Anaerolineales bacterium]